MQELLDNYNGQELLSAIQQWDDIQRDVVNLDSLDNDGEEGQE